MKKLLLFAAAVLAAGLLGWLPATQRDVGTLLPVQTLILSIRDGELVLEGGEGLRGTGGSWNEAMADLRATAPGDAFFGSTGQIILVDRAAALLEDVLGDPSLRPAARIYAGTGEPDPESTTAYLDAHRSGITLQSLQAAALEGRETRLPLLVCREGRYWLKDG